MTISQGVEPVAPASAGTQPVVPFGRIGRRTRTHPPEPPAAATTGNVIGAPVNGVRTGTSPTTRASARGAARAGTDRSRIKRVVTPTVLARGRDVPADEAVTDTADDISIATSSTHASLAVLIRRPY